MKQQQQTKKKVWPPFKEQEPLPHLSLPYLHLYVGTRLGLVSSMMSDPEQNNTQQRRCKAAHFKPIQAKVLDCFGYS